MSVLRTRPVAVWVAAVMVVGGGVLVLPGCSTQEESTPAPHSPAIDALADTPVADLPPEITRHRDFSPEPAYALGSYDGVDYYAGYLKATEPDEAERQLCLIVDLGQDEGAAWTCDTDSDDLTLTFLNVGPGDHILVGDAADTAHLIESGWKRVGLNVWTRPAS